MVGTNINAADVLPEAKADNGPDEFPLDMTRIEPVGDRLFVEQLQVDDTRTEGGIFVPEQAREKPVLGIVKAVGPGPWHDRIPGVPSPAQVGDIVLYNMYGGQIITVARKEIFVLRGSEVIAVQHAE